MCYFVVVVAVVALVCWVDYVKLGSSFFLHQSRGTGGVPQRAVAYFHWFSPDLPK